MLLLAVLIAPAFAQAKVELCRHINNRIERDACYKRQDEARAAAQKSAAAKPRAPAADTIKAENDRASTRLKSICRGC